MTDLKKKFGKRLRQIRRQKELTQEQLAEGINVTPEFISNIERGINAPSFDTLEKLAKSLDVPVKALFDYEEDHADE